MTDLNIEDFSIDKSNWTKVKFGDVAYEPKETVKDPVAQGIKHVIGLEHIDSEDIHLRRSASIEDGTTFTKRFSKGDVLFGRRRAYLKKAARAEFEGICSGDIIVFRAREDHLLPDLLPFLVNNDKFFDYAVTHSAGGLSPRVKFKDLANYEFLLPPKDQQIKIAELLCTINNVIEREVCIKESLSTSLQSFRKHLIENGVESKTGNSKKIKFGAVCKNWQLLKLSHFATLVGGSAFKSSRFQESGSYQVLRIGNLTSEGFNYNKSPVYINDLTSNDEKVLIPKDALVLSLTGSNGKRDYGFPALMDVDNVYLLNQRLVMIIPDKETMLPEFLFLLTEMEIFKAWFFLNATGSANQENVSIEDVANIPLPVPPIEQQIKILGCIGKLRHGIQAADRKIGTSKGLKKDLINRVF